MTVESERLKEIAAAVLADHGAESDLYTLSTAMIERSGISRQRARQYMAQAIRKARWAALPEDERARLLAGAGGKRPGSGRKAGQTPHEAIAAHRKP